MSSTRVAAAAAVAAVALLLAGCGDHKHVTKRPAKTESAAPARPSIALKPLGTVKISAVEEGPLAVGHNGDTGHDIVAMPTGERGVDTWNTVTVVDPSAGKSRKVARSAWRGGLINWIATTGQWVVYTDQSAEQGDADPSVLWRVHAVNLATGRQRTLASSGRTRTPFIPRVGAQEGVVYWTQAEPDRSAKEIVWRPGHGAPYAVLRHMEMTPDSATVAGGALFYLGPNGKGLTGHTTGGDCWRVPLSGGTPVVVTHTALAMGCAVRGSRLVWSQHIDPDDPNPPEGEIMDDPYSLWTLDWTADGKAAEPVKLQEGYSEAYLLHPTEHALAWLQDSMKVMVTSLTTPSNQVEVPGRVYDIETGSGDLLAHTQRTRSGISVTLDRIEVNEP